MLAEGRGRWAVSQKPKLIYIEQGNCNARGQFKKRQGYVLHLHEFSKERCLFSQCDRQLGRKNPSTPNRCRATRVQMLYH